MSRPKKNRIVNTPPIYSSFKPSGVMKTMLERQDLSLDEYEAIRLADYLHLEHQEASLEMEISRSTFTRLLDKARGKVAVFLVEGRELTIEGGSVHFRGNILKCRDCGQVFSSSLDSGTKKCPHCGSSRLIDMAGGYGHGNCCVRHRNGRNQS